MVHSVLAGLIDLVLSLPTYLLEIVDIVWGIQELIGSQNAVLLQTITSSP